MSLEVIWKNHQIGGGAEGRWDNHPLEADAIAGIPEGLRQRLRAFPISGPPFLSHDRREVQSECSWSGLRGEIDDQVQAAPYCPDCHGESIEDAELACARARLLNHGGVLEGRVDGTANLGSIPASTME